MASVKQRGEHSWRVRWLLGGRNGQYQVVTLPSERLALQADRIIRDHQHKITDDDVYSAVLGLPPVEPEPPKGPTLAEWAQTWLKAKLRVTPYTRKKYRQHLDVMLQLTVNDRVFGDILLTLVSGTDIAAVLRHLQEVRKLEPTTITRYYSTLHGMLKFAVGEGKIASNPARRTDWIRDAIAFDDASDGEKHVYLTKQQFQTLLAATPEEFRPLAWFLAYTGCRWSEATAVSVGSVDLMGKRPAVKIFRAWKRGEDGRRRYLGATKGRSRRTLVMPSRSTVDVLAPVVAGRSGDELLFHGSEGPWTDASEPNELDYDHFEWIFQGVVASLNRCTTHPPIRDDGRPDRRKMATSSCGCPTLLGAMPTLHDLRHTHCAWLIADGKPLLAISRRLGHHSITITEKTYGGILPDLAADLADGLDAPIDSDLLAV